MLEKSIDIPAEGRELIFISPEVQVVMFPVSSNLWPLTSEYHPLTVLLLVLDHAVGGPSEVVPLVRSLKSSFQILGKLHIPVALLFRSLPPVFPCSVAVALAVPQICWAGFAVATGGLSI